MKKSDTFFRSVCRLAVPAALQSMLQSSFSMVDQIMIGQLGETCVAGVGLAGKFASMYSVVIAAVGAAAGIMLSQYLGQKNGAEARRSFFRNLLLGLGVAALFTAVCALLPGPVMRVYTKDAPTWQAAASYLALLSGTFLPLAGSTLLSTAFRCAEKPGLPLYAGTVSAVLNTGLNEILIFGRLGLPAMGAAGAAIATVAAQCVNFLLLLLASRQLTFLRAEKAPRRAARLHWSRFLSVLLPLLLCEASWSLGENVYAAIYGRMGTAESAAMTLTAPIQGLVIGALCGLSQAAGVIVGKRLGGGDSDGAYRAAKRLMVYGAVGAAVLCAAVVLTSGAYVEIYRVDRTVKLLTRQLLFVYALAAPFKVLNMILGGGILRSGGRTAYVMGIDMLGTWGFGVPLGLLSAFVWKLPIAYVYLLLSLEECVRFALSMVVFHRKSWMNRLDG